MEVGKIYYSKDTDLYIKILSASLRIDSRYDITCYKNYRSPNFNSADFTSGVAFPKDWVLYSGSNLKTRSGYGTNLPDRLR